jgi:hypothetical protein
METYCSKTKKGLPCPSTRVTMESKLSGGSGKDDAIFKMAIDIGSEHKISLKAGNPNRADGNCLYESIMDQINKRICFTENLGNTPGFYRRIWNIEGENKVKQSVWYPYKYTEEEWKAAWKILQDTNQYDIEYFGNMAILSCALSLKKDILIINTPWKKTNASAHGPVNVVYADGMDSTNKKSTNIPLVLAYNGDHFESLIPADKDVAKTVQLVDDYKTGTYKIPDSLKELFNFNKIVPQKGKKERRQRKNPQKKKI